MMTQDYSAYSPEDFDVWKILFERQYALIGDKISRDYKAALEQIGFNAQEIPRIEKIDEILADSTGWKTVVVPGILPDAEFFQLLADKKFPATTWLRKRSQLDYLEEPDMFHDVFGHIPLLTDKNYTGFLEGLGHIALTCIDDPKRIELITRLYWFTVEFGLMREDEKLRIYGAGIVSSVGESKYCMQSETPPFKHEFNLEEILRSPFRKDVFQDKYFVGSGYDQLFNCLPELELKLKEPELLLQA